MGVFFLLNKIKVVNYCNDNVVLITTIKMSTWKLLQRRCYDLLSHKSSLLIIVIAFTCTFIGIIHFSEVSKLILPKSGILLNKILIII